jgi:hypothetical protein
MQLRGVDLILRHTCNVSRHAGEIGIAYNDCHSLNTPIGIEYNDLTRTI